MAQMVGFLSTLVTVYTMIVFFRIILTWFSWMRGGPMQVFLARITDPYLNLFRRFRIFRVGVLDFSPIAGVAVLSLVNGVLSAVARQQTVSLGIILAMIVQMVWSVISFLLGFMIIVFALRLAAYLGRFNMYNRFWRIVDMIYQPVSYRINRLLLKNRIMSFTSSCLLSIACLGLVFLGLRFLAVLLANVLIRLPI